MIGLVIICHNRNLAQELINFSEEMKQFDFPIENGGGTSGEIYGTEPEIIVEAVKRADNGEGVLLFVDLGSSIMSSMIALEMLGNNPKYRIVDAPFLEGVISAVAANYPGVTLEELVQISEESKDFVKIK